MQPKKIYWADDEVDSDDLTACELFNLCFIFCYFKIFYFNASFLLNTFCTLKLPQNCV